MFPGVPNSSLHLSPGLKPRGVNGHRAQTFVPAMGIMALKTLSGGDKRQVEHLAFGDAEDLQSQQLSSSPEGHIPQHDLGVLRRVFAHRGASQQLPKLCWA